MRIYGRRPKLSTQFLVLVFYETKLIAYEIRTKLKTSALSPTVELGAEWPPMGIEAINPFELPLLNTVYRVIILIVHNVAVLVKIQLYELNLTLDYSFFTTLSEPSFLFLPFSITRSPLVSSNQKRNMCSPAKNYSNSASHDKFYKWFAGFSDAEGSFGIFPLLNSKTKNIEGFSPFGRPNLR